GGFRVADVACSQHSDQVRVGQCAGVVQVKGVRVAAGEVFLGPVGGGGCPSRRAAVVQRLACHGQLGGAEFQVVRPGVLRVVGVGESGDQFAHVRGFRLGEDVG